MCIRDSISLGLAIKFTGTIMDLLLPWILSYMIDDVVPLKEVPRIVFWGGAMVACAAVALITNIVANRMASWVAQHTTEALRHDLFSKISHLSCGQIDSFSIPSLESRLTSDTYNVHQMIGMMQRLGVRAPIPVSYTHLLILLSTKEPTSGGLYGDTHTDRDGPPRAV